MIRFAEFDVYQLAPRCLTLKWNIENIPSGYTEYLTVHRSESPEGPWEPIKTDLTGREYFHDHDANIYNPMLAIYYKLTGLVSDGEDPPDIQTIKESDVEHLRIRPDAKAREIIRRNNLLLEQYVGTPAYFLIRRTWGPRCTMCYDPELDKVTTSDCPQCFNTKFSGGFYEPILSYVANEAIGKSLKDVGIMKLAPGARPFWTTNFPELKRGDVMVDCQNVRWKIEDVGLQTIHLKAKMRQIFTAVQIPAGDILYDIEIPNVHQLKAIRDYHIWESIETVDIT